MVCAATLDFGKLLKNFLDLKFKLQKGHLVPILSDL